MYVGDLKLTPYVEQDVGYASNPFGAASAAKGSALSTTEVGVGLQSELEPQRADRLGEARLQRVFRRRRAPARPTVPGVVDYRYDASRDLSFDTEGRFNLTTETNAQLGLGGATDATP